MGLLHEEQRSSIQQVQGIQIALKIRSRPFDQIMADNSLQMNSKSYVKNQGLRGSCLLLIIHNIMGLRNGRMELSWKLQKQFHDQYLPMHLWVEATRTTVYVQNRTPHRVLKNKTPEEVFSGKKPEFNRLRIFGCPVYIHIPKEKKMKLDPLGKKSIFV